MVAEGADELLEIEREHLCFVHEADGDGADVFELDAEQGAAENVAITPFLNEILHVGNGFGTFLDFVKENQSLTFDQRFIAKGGEPHQNIGFVSDVTEDVAGFWCTDEVNLHKRVVVPAAKVLDNGSFADLPCAID